jgi:hypothetical protein
MPEPLLWSLELRAQKIQQQSLNHETFCDTFQSPKTLHNELLRIYGISERELKQAMRKIGFVEVNRMYNDIYYQTLTIAYLVGLEFNDQNLRRMALLLIDIKIWNGRKLRAFPTFCDPDVARYVLNYILQGNHTLKKAGSAFEYIDQYSVPHLDNKYAPSIANNLDSDREGLRKLIETIWSRYEQLFRSIRKAYYNAHKDGKKEIITNKYSQQYGTGEMVESKESFTGNIERLVDKIEKNAMLKRNAIMKPEAQKIIKDKFNVSTSGIQKINSWIEDEDNHEELKYFFELVFNTLKPKTEADICKYDVASLAPKVTSAKKEPNLIKAKEIISHALEEILGEQYKRFGNQSLYRYRLLISYAFIIYAKIMLCKTP